MFKTHANKDLLGFIKGKILALEKKVPHLTLPRLAATFCRNTQSKTTANMLRDIVDEVIMAQN